MKKVYNFLTNAVLHPRVKLDCLYKVCEMDVRMPTNGVMARRRAKLVEWTTTRHHYRGDVLTSNACDLGFRAIDILPDVRKRHLYFAVHGLGIHRERSLRMHCLHPQEAWGGAATVGIMDLLLGEINGIAARRKSSNYSFPQALPFANWNQTEGCDGPLVRQEDRIQFQSTS